MLYRVVFGIASRRGHTGFFICIGGAEVMLRVVPCRRLKVVRLWVFLPLNMYDTHLCV